MGPKISYRLWRVMMMNKGPRGDQDNVVSKIKSALPYSSPLNYLPGSEIVLLLKGLNQIKPAYTIYTIRRVLFHSQSLSTPPMEFLF